MTNLGEELDSANTVIHTTRIFTAAASVRSLGDMAKNTGIA